jgi:hypothetical protein
MLTNTNTSEQTIQVTWLPIVDEEHASQLIAESDRPFSITIDYGNGPDGAQQVQSEHDGLVHFVSLDIPATAEVEVGA